MPLKELILITAAAGIAHAIARYSWRKGVAQGEVNAKKDTQLALLRGMAIVRLQDARHPEGRDIIAEMNNAERLS
ncbi:hypothetical protein HD597_010043 [Nonomuraea thailandensis]|uniref:Uncharacterized protein n=1 Tax=Nonomuraea thailandensis TaxID=1188745 RepID=A0A9X2K7C2_9ACTN|nr:hypothetical protein [Nonomuraea thailandensis]MCP2363023.1 hypothetical protein [Nonomuraea thailandensis]